MDSKGNVCIRAKRCPSKASDREFDNLFVDSLDEGLGMVLGEIAKWVVYETIDSRYQISRDRICEKLNEFTVALEAIFGVTASRTISWVVVKALYSKLGLTFVERPDWRLPDYVTEARSRMALFNGSIERGLVRERPLES